MSGNDGVAGGVSILQRADNVIEMKPDAEYAVELRREISALLEPVTDLMNQSRQRGLIVNFSIGHDGFGRMRVAEITVVRPL